MRTIRGDLLLARCREAPKEIRELTWRREHAREMATAITRAIGGDGARSGERDKLAEYAAEIDRIETQIADRRREYAEELEATGRMIAGCGERVGGILRRHFVDGWSYREIAEEAMRSPRTVKQTVADALKWAARMQEPMSYWYLKRWDARRAAGQRRV